MPPCFVAQHYPQSARTDLSQQRLKNSIRDDLPGTVLLLASGTESILLLASHRDGLPELAAVTAVAAGPLPHRRQCATTSCSGLA